MFFKNLKKVVVIFEVLISTKNLKNYYLTTFYLTFFIFKYQFSTFKKIKKNHGKLCGLKRNLFVFVIYLKNNPISPLFSFIFNGNSLIFEKSNNLVKKQT